MRRKNIISKIYWVAAINLKKIKCSNNNLLLPQFFLLIHVKELSKAIWQMKIYILENAIVANLLDLEYKLKSFSNRVINNA